MIILLHTSKTMRPAITASNTSQRPALLEQTQELQRHIKQLDAATIKRVMKVSDTLAHKTHQQIADWTANKNHQRTAIDSFLGDIYSGLRVADWTEQDRTYANQRLYILSGLYGVLRPLDGIYPYRLEMGYKVQTDSAKNLYEFWGDTIAGALPKDDFIINLAADEYSKTVLPYISGTVIAPKFLTISPKTKQPTFVVVHAKIARGAFARWLIKERVNEPSRLKEFNDLNYRYSSKLSTDTQPVFICKTFGGIGLSMRLTEDSATLS